MSFKIQISKKAEIEINQSIDWYNEQKVGLGKQFYSKVKAIIKVISKNPNTFEQKYNNFRFATVDVFPFIVVYFISETDVIVISAVFHTSRNPDEIF